MGDEIKAGTQDRRQMLRRLRFGGPLRLRRVAEREMLLLVVICALDMYSTLWWVATGQAKEANPLLAPTLAMHPMTFVLAKSLSCLPTLLVVPRLGRSHPRVTTWLLRAVLAAYVLIYLVAIK